MTTPTATPAIPTAFPCEWCGPATDTCARCGATGFCHPAVRIVGGPVIRVCCDRRACTRRRKAAGR